MKKRLTIVLALILMLCMATVACAEGKRTVTFWHCFGGTIGEAMQATVDAFNASQDEIFVEASYQGAYDDTLTKLKAALPAGTGPDVFQMFELGTCYLSGTDYVIPFQDMLDKDPYISLDQVEGVLRNYYTVNGKMMCIPINPSSPVMYYNKTAFEKAGITDVPTTFAEIEAIAEKLTAVEGNPEYAMGLSIYGWFFENLLAGANQLTIAQWKILDTYWALILPYLTSAFCIFNMRQAYKSLPTELREAAIVDGCNSLQFFLRIGIPLTVPFLGALGIYTFLQIWNQYLWPLLVTNSTEMRTVQIGIGMLQNSDAMAYGPVMAGTVLILVPSILVFIFGPKTLISGLTTRAVKG